MNEKIKWGIFQATLQISGFVIIGALGGWWDALGVFLVIYGHNVEYHK